MKSESQSRLSSETAVAGEPAGVFMVTLCRLTKPVSVRPPPSSPLESFTFFIGRLRGSDGSERLYLHMGYFATLSDAQQWAQRLRTRYPSAIATPAPRTLLQPRDADIPTLQTTATHAAPAIPEFPPVRDEPLSDTQVMRILETRHAGADDSSGHERNETRVELLRPDDTQTKRTLKDAVVEGVPVPFAVQLGWSVQPIDASRVHRLDIFKGYTLYRTERRRGGRSCYFLRLGFFTDASSAKEFACQVRSTYASAAVVPVTEQEFLHAGEARIDTPLPAGPFCQVIDGLPSTDRLAPPTPNPVSRKSVSVSQETLEETLEVLAQREMWTQSDRLSDTGVRHLKVTIEERPARSSARHKWPNRFA